MKTQEEYAREIDEIVRRDVESYQSDWFKIDKEIFMLPVEPAYMGRRSGKTRRSPCPLAWLSNKITYKYVRKYEY